MLVIIPDGTKAKTKYLKGWFASKFNRPVIFESNFICVFLLMILLC